MGRRRSTKLPRGITERRGANGTTYRINFVDQHGRRRFEPAGTVLREAIQQRARRLAEVEAGTYGTGEIAPGASLDELAARFFAAARRKGRRSVDDDEARYRLHIAPHFGEQAIGELRPAHVAAWLEDLAGGHLSPKSVRNCHGVLHSMLELARFEEQVIANPASLPRGKLPRVGKKKKARFTREEHWRLLTAPPEAIAPWRRVFYALQGLAGLRLGEASGRRWRDLDTDTPGLAALLVSSQYDDQPLKTADGGEDTRERLVPVHPALAAELEEWRRVGFVRLFGRHPRPGDWICPDPRTGKPRTQNQAIKALYRDLERVGIPHRDPSTGLGRACHAFRHSFISLARSDGARKDALEPITHNPRGDILDGYTSWEWPTMCEAVACLSFDRERADVVQLAQPRAVAVGAEDDPQDDESAPSDRSAFASSEDVSSTPQRAAERATGSIETAIVVEAAGVEPASESVRLTLASTCVALVLLSHHESPKSRLSMTPTVLISRRHPEPCGIRPVSSTTPPVER